MNYIKTLKWEMIIFSLVCIGVGSVLAFMPKTSTVILGAAIATLLFIYAIRHFVEYARRYNTNDVFKYELVVGIIFTILGIIVLTKMDSILSIISYMIAAIIFISGLMKLENAFDLKKMGRHWVPMLVIAIMLVIIGIIIFMAPMNKSDDGRSTAGDVVLIATGISLMFTGLVNLITTLSISGKINRFNKEIKDNMTSGDVIDVEYEEVDKK